MRTRKRNGPCGVNCERVIDVVTIMVLKNNNDMFIFIF